MIVVRRARPADAAAIGAVHVAAWRSAYPGLLPDAYLSALSARRKAAEYERSIGAGGVFVAAATGAPRIAGFVTVGRGRAWNAVPPDPGAPAAHQHDHDADRSGAGSGGQGSVHGTSDPPDARPAAPAGGRAPLGDGEIETLYVLDDWRDRGVGRRLIGAGAACLAERGCRSAFVWVLRDNPSRWFYARIGGRVAMADTVRVAGMSLPQVAYVWDPIDRLIAAFSSGAAT